MTNIEYIEGLQKKGKSWFLEGHLLDFITLNNYYPEVFTNIKIESFDRVKTIVFETEDKEYFYENFKFRNYKHISIYNNAELSVTFDYCKETVVAILTTKSGIYKFIFDIKILDIYVEA